MEAKRPYFRLGLFVVVTLGILFAILFILGGRSLFQPTFTFETYFDSSVAGLELGAPVKFRGVPMGAVSEITLSGASYEQDVPIDARKGYIVIRGKVNSPMVDVHQLREEFPQLIAKGLRAQTQLAGITGQQYLALDIYDPTKYPALEFDWTPEYPYVPSAPSLTGEIITNVQAFLASLNEADIKDLGQNLNKLVQTADRKLDDLAVGVLSDEALGLLKDAQVTVQHIDQVITGAPIEEAVGHIASASGRLDKLLANPGLGQTVDNATDFTARLRAIARSGRLDRIVKHLDETIERADAMLGDNQYDVRVIVQDLRVTADNLRTLSETAKRDPAGVLFGGPPKRIDLRGQERR
jgi:phospholipid/cholesterol/gamma-HCH transport system substrate-binding protein/paraquat-inducible protein B